MWPETSRAGAAVVLAGLTAVLLVKGILPAMSGLNTDFPNYLTAAKIVADGAEEDILDPLLRLRPFQPMSAKRTPR